MLFQGLTMLDAHIRPFIDGPLDRAGKRLAEIGVSANAVTLAGFAIGMLAVPAIAGQAYLLGLALILCNRLADGLDGAVARARGPSDLGGYLDIVLDFIFYSAVAFSFSLARPENALWSALLLFSFMGTGSSFLAYAILAAKRGLTTRIRGSKSLYYLGGLTEGSETIIAFVLFCLFPSAFPVLAAVFSAMCWITTVSRILAAYRSFRRN